MEEDDIGSMLNGLSRKYQQKYGIAVFSVDAKKTEKGFELSGIVLTGNQKEETFDLISSSGIKISGEKISVLSDQKQRDEIGWGVVKPKIADLRSRFVSNKIMNSVILKRIRCSQAFDGEVLRIIYKNEDQFLAQQSDLTLGWINKNEVVFKKESLRRKWKNDNIVPVNKTVKCRIPVEAVAREAERFLGTKYVLGGRSKDGIDCSALVQVVYRNVSNIVLPKHSWDQKKIGKVTDLEKVKTGDLIFLIKKKNGHKHVGIVQKKGSHLNLIHASLDLKKVVAESLEKVFEKYDFVEARRIIE